MKKILAIVFVMCLTLSATAQKKKKKPANNDCYLTEATTTFDLSEDKKSELNELLVQASKDRAAIKKGVKAGEITKDQVKGKTRGVNRKYFSDLAKLTGKSKKEVMTFVKEVGSKCKKKKKKKKQE
ncbi:hypothetical protein KO506_08180 [Polaribacter vadi]|uniref:hypothetical protein n=1 Tax=Polaribacter TaxID=52959 RepID=UPI001C08A5F0|nr:MULTISPECIES: hypothetical protein [Polaribacter]MBU3011377.1 hypothetical protein [Polaribacter vadi]MDO6741189.1 hypothetical protein [Polaribacter sp. 1_MG-2023]